MNSSSQLDVLLKDIEELICTHDKAINVNLVLAKMYYALLILSGKAQ